MYYCEIQMQILFHLIQVHKGEEEEGGATAAPYHLVVRFGPGSPPWHSHCGSPLDQRLLQSVYLTQAAMQAHNKNTVA